MKKIKDSKTLLFENMVKLNPDFKKKLNEDSPFYAEHLIDSSIRTGLITQEEYNKNPQLFNRAAEETAEYFSDWDEGQGFGSSDMTAAKKIFLDNAGIKNDYINNRLTRIENEVATPTGDVANLQKAVSSTSTVQYADSRIDTPQELEAAFGDWISRTGYSLNNKPIRPISISQVQTLVKNAMTKLGYK